MRKSDGVRRMKVDIAWSEDGPDGVFSGGIREIEVVAASDFDLRTAALEEAIIHHVEAMRELRAERDAAITAGQKLADLVTLLGGYDGPGYLAAPNQGERPDYVAAARLFSKIMRDETNGAAAALAAWRSVSGSSEPR